MKILDYLLMKDPGARLAPASQIPTRRIILSLVGLILGIFFSFLITGINANEVTHVTISFPKLNELLKLGIITFVICMITYQGLYSNLKLYENEPAFLVIFISFQYGFFWQSLVKGGAALLS